MNRYYSNVLYNECARIGHESHNITQDNDGTINKSAELGKGEVVYNVGMTTVKRLPSPSVYSNVLYNGLESITLPLLYSKESLPKGRNDSESEVGCVAVMQICNQIPLPHSIIRGDNK